MTTSPHKKHVFAPADEQERQQTYNSQGLIRLVSNPLFTTMVSYVFDQPLFDLFMHGPSLGGWGFHEGKNRALICSEYTGVPESHWAVNAAECDAIIIRKFNALLISVHLLVYFLVVAVVLWSVCGFAVFVCCCRRRTRESEPLPLRCDRSLCYRCRTTRSCQDLLAHTQAP